jgi:hypothetical protein
MHTVELPHSKVRLTFGDDFSKEKLTVFLDDVIQDRVDLASAKQRPVETLAALGIQIEPDDVKRISSADLMDYVQFPKVRADASPAGVAQVAVAVVTFLI